MKIALVAVLVVLGMAVAVLLIGLTLPARHTATRSARLPAPPPRVFAVLTDVAAYPAWRDDVERVEVLSQQPLRFREHGDNGAILFEEVERLPPHRLVVRIADPELPFGGTWTYGLTADGDATVLTIREDGEVRNPVFRFVSRLILGHTATLDAYLRALTARVASEH